MTWRGELQVAEVRPPLAEVLRLQGMPVDVAPSGRVADLLREAFDIYTDLAVPVGLGAEITAEEFAAIYRGEGENEPETPLAEIYPRAARLALFAVTLGEPICARIGELFAARDFALATMLDSVASSAADQAAAAVEERYGAHWMTSGAGNIDGRALRYSPGYCGWHVSGQKALFARLEPEVICVTLRDSCLMQPLKSVSGVIVHGPAEIHEFADDYPFCAECTTRGCRQRL